MEQAILGGGCFWCLEPVFSALKGVKEVQPGFCGGHVDNPSYEQVCQQDTGHVEVVCVKFDPNEVNYKTLLEVFFGTHDPTTLNRQGNDIGPQYASTVFYLNNDQKRVAEQVIQEAQEYFPEKIVTSLQNATTFWPAEKIHQNYYDRNPQQGYCQFVIAPKMAKFRERYAHLIMND